MSTQRGPTYKDTHTLPSSCSEIQGPLASEGITTQLPLPSPGHHRQLHGLGTLKGTESDTDTPMLSLETRPSPDRLLVLGVRFILKDYTTSPSLLAHWRVPECVTRSSTSAHCP